MRGAAPSMRQQKIANHVGRFGFDFYDNENKLLSVGLDGVFKEYDITNESLTMSRQLDCEEASALCVAQPSNQIFIGNHDKRNIVRVLDYAESSGTILSEEIASVLGPIYQIHQGGDDPFVVVSGQESKPTVIRMNKGEEGIKKRVLSENHSGSGLFSAIDRKGETLISLGCDGSIHIYNLATFESPKGPKFLTSLQLCFPCVPEKEFVMCASFNASADLIILPGNNSIQVIKKDENSKWIMERIPEISHNKSIQVCEWADDDRILITACVGKEVKVWDFEMLRCLESFKCDEFVSSIRYSKQQDAIFIAGVEGSLRRVGPLAPLSQRKKKNAMETIDAILSEPLVSKPLVAALPTTPEPKQKKTNSSNSSSKKKRSEPLPEIPVAQEPSLELEDPIFDESPNNEPQQLHFPQPQQKEKQQQKQEKHQLQQKQTQEQPQPQQKVQQQKQENQPAIVKAPKPQVEQSPQISEEPVVNNANSKKLKLEELNRQMELKGKKLDNQDTPSKESINGSGIQDSTDMGSEIKGKKVITQITQQDIIHSSSVGKQSNRAGLAWNLIGYVGVVEKQDKAFIEVEFADKEMHSNISMENEYNYSMAAMNSQGIILASKAISSTQEYESEEDLERFQFNPDAYDLSFIRFQSFVDKSVIWNISLEKDENAETVAIGEGWCAVQTDAQLVRIFGFSSLEDHCLCINKPVVAIAGHKHLLACVSLEGEPVCGCQSLRVTIFDARTSQIISESSVPLTPFSTLRWIGFSDEGLLLTQDTKTTIRAFFGFSNWTPIFQRSASQNYWLKGMYKFEMVGFLLGSEEQEPLLTSFHYDRKLPLASPVPEQSSGGWVEVNKDLYQLRHQQLILKHEVFRYKNLEATKSLEESIAKLQKEIDLRVVRLFQRCFVEGEHEKALSLVKSNIIHLSGLDSCIALVKGANEGKNLENSLINLKKIKQKLVQTIKSIASEYENDDANTKTIRPNSKLIFAKQTKDILDSSEEEENDDVNEESY